LWHQLAQDSGPDPINFMGPRQQAAGLTRWMAISSQTHKYKSWAEIRQHLYFQPPTGEMHFLCTNSLEEIHFWGCNYCEPMEFIPHFLRAVAGVFDMSNGHTMSNPSRLVEWDAMAYGGSVPLQPVRSTIT
jgi:hypothetical protein